MRVPYYYYREIKTPLMLLGIRFMKDEQGQLWIKFWKKPRKLLYKGSANLE